MKEEGGGGSIVTAARFEFRIQDTLKVLDLIHRSMSVWVFQGILWKKYTSRQIAEVIKSMNPSESLKISQPGAFTL